MKSSIGPRFIFYFFPGKLPNIIKSQHHFQRCEPFINVAVIYSGWCYSKAATLSVMVDKEWKVWGAGW